jgi:hypothetical protein
MGARSPEAQLTSSAMTADMSGSEGSGRVARMAAAARK